MEIKVEIETSMAVVKKYYNKSSQYGKPFCGNINYVASSYKNPAPALQKEN